jgi:hypothetical protein
MHIANNQHNVGRFLQKISAGFANHFFEGKPPKQALLIIIK